MANWLKRSAATDIKAQSEHTNPRAVALALADIEQRGDDALREMSIKFDG